MTPPRVRILHETNPQKYFPALYALHDQGKIRLTGAHRTSVCKEWLRAGLRDRTALGQRSRNALADAAFRLHQHRISGEIIVLGFAPWDARLLWYRGLARRNRIVYHTSWPDWRTPRTPRQPPLVTGLMQRRWKGFLAHPNVSTVAVLDPVAATLRQQMNTEATVIPHAVPDLFFDHPRGAETGPLRLLYVAELSPKKGLPQALALLETLPAGSATLTVIGRGPLEPTLPPHVRYLGAVTDRAALAREMAAHDILLSLSQKTSTWEELFGLVIAEALATGCGVIASDHTGPRAILQDAPGLVAQDDAAAVHALVSHFAQDRARLRAFRAAQRPKAQAFALSGIAARWQALFDSLAHG